MNHLQYFAASLLAQVENAAGAPEVEAVAPAGGPLSFFQERPDFAVFLLILVTTVISFVVASFYTKSIRMSELGWKVGLILSCLFVSAEIITFKWPPRLGVDLKGGVVYMAQISPIADDENVKPEDLVPRLKERVDPTGTKEIMIRPYGSDMIEIVIPDVTDAEGDRIWDNLTKQGVMQFQIVARSVDESSQQTLLMGLADAQAAERNLSPWILDNQGNRIGRWVGIGRKRNEFGDVGPYRYVPTGTAIIRDANTGVLLDPPATALVMEEGNEGVALTKWAEGGQVEGLPPGEKADLEILMEVSNFDVTGDSLANPTQGFDDRNRPAVNFQLKGKGIGYFYKLTSDNINRPLGIVMDNRLLSAPNINSAISSQGQIMGNFDQAEVEDLVNILKSGRLPATIKEQWVSKDQVDSNIGRQMQGQGLLAIAASFIAVMLFMLVYYRFAGIVACFALIVNVAMIVALTMLINFPFSLTSLAGLVLTVGMSVDANVLIYERIREELAKGTSLRMGIRNGFARATTTIVDANLTTLITAVVLYAIGTEQIRGFAVTLILGILISMFTAIFCARVIFEIAERKRFLKKLSMLQLLNPSRFEFTRFWKMAATASVVLIIVGIVATSFRYGSRKDLFSYDLRGGTSARVVLKEAMEPEEFRQRLKDRFAGVGEWQEKGPVASGSVIFDVDSSPISADTYEANTVFRVDTGLKPWEAQDESISQLREERKALVIQLESASGDERETLEEQIQAKTSEIDAKTKRPDDYPEFTEILADVFKDEIARYELAIDDIKYEPVNLETSAPSTTENAPAGSNDEVKDASNDASEEESSSEPESPAEGSGDTSKDTESGDGQSSLQAPSKFQFVNFVPAQDEEPAQDSDAEASAPANPSEAVDGSQEASTTADKPTADNQRVNAEATLRFIYPISEDGVREAIQEVSERENLSVNADSVGLVEVASLEGSQGTSWRINVKNTSRDDMKKLTAGLVGDFEKKPYFRSLADVGGQIAEDAQVQALVAILASLIGIVVYLWFRFHRVIFGLAAVVALVHDVAIVLGVIALSCWLNPVLGSVLLVDNFKISLPVIAAFLTIIGYSLNDTIVVFDRIREVKGKNPKLTGEMLDISISQTLSRTILTSITTLIVVGILYFLGGEAIHAFAFSLVIGVVVGTYSSIFVASPALYWLAKRSEKA